jgi:hypothetical protein
MFISGRPAITAGLAAWEEWRRTLLSWEQNEPAVKIELDTCDKYIAIIRKHGMEEPPTKAAAN